MADDKFVYDGDKAVHWDPADTKLIEIFCAECEEDIQIEDRYEQICMSCLHVIICERCHGDWTGKRYKGPIMAPCKMPGCQYLYCKYCIGMNFQQQEIYRANWLCERTCNTTSDGTHSIGKYDHHDCRHDEAIIKSEQQRLDGVCVPCYLRAARCVVCAKRSITNGKCIICPPKRKNPIKVPSKRVVIVEPVIKRRRKSDVERSGRDKSRAIELQRECDAWTKSIRK